jgi:hypothetical protein
MAKKKEWVTPNRMKFDSDCKTFNRQVDCISIGNVIGHVQLSGCVRPRNETECNGYDFPKRHLQEYDLCWLLKNFPNYVKEYIRKLDYAEDHPLIAYEFRHWRGKKKVVHGYVVTTGSDNGHKLLRKWYPDRMKSKSVINEAVKYIAD